MKSSKPWKSARVLILMFGIALPGVALGQEAGDLGDPSIGVVEQPRPLAKEVADANETDSEQAPRERLKFLLSGYEYFPTRDDLSELGTPEQVSTLLRELASKSEHRPSQRLRAVDALGYYRDEATRNYLETLIAASAEKPPKDKVQRRTRKLMRHHAITSLAKAHGPDALATLEPLLVTDDVQLRMTAISAIGKHAGPQGKERLRKLANSETNPVVKRELRKFVEL